MEYGAGFLGDEMKALISPSKFILAVIITTAFFLSLAVNGIMFLYPAGASDMLGTFSNITNRATVISELTDTNDMLRRNNAILVENNTKLADANTGLKASNIALGADVARLVNANTDLVARNTKLENTNSGLKKKNDKRVDTKKKVDKVTRRITNRTVSSIKSIPAGKIPILGLATIGVEVVDLCATIVDMEEIRNELDIAPDPNPSFGTSVVSSACGILQNGFSFW